MTKRMVGLAVMILIAGMGLGYGSGYVIFQPRISQLQSDLSNLQSEAFTLTTNFNDLNATHTGLVIDHEILNSTYNGLQTDYNRLNATYSTCVRAYDLLHRTHIEVQADYDLLERTFDSSLHSRQTPSVVVLEDWLLEDKTDEIEYDFPDFVCTEFAVTLAIHARAKQYDMGVIWMQGYINGTREAFNHVLNAMVTTEGLVYVEPQSDQIWWYDDHQAMTAGRVYHIWESVYIDVKKVEIILDY